MIGPKCECFFFAAMIVLIAAGCAPIKIQPAATALPPEPFSSPVPAIPILAPQNDRGSTETAGLANAPLPLEGPGPYFPAKRQYTMDYHGRKDGKSVLTIWYPAIKPAGYAGTVASKAEPDRSGAPYPLLLSSKNSGNDFAPHLVSYGFVAIGVDGQGPSNSWGIWLTDFPLETLAALDYVASSPLDGLEGMIDAEHAGVYGYSFDGYDALAMSGARIDEAYYLEQCRQAAAHPPALDARWVEYICAPAAAWDDFTAHAGEAITESPDGLWQPMTDPRIRAVMPMAPEGAWLFGERGLAAADRPTLIIGATEDRNYKGCPYLLEAVPIFERLGTSERGLISFVGQGHLMIFEATPKAQMGHFAVAFFGRYLREQKEYAGYFSEEFVSQVPGLAWGPVPDTRPPFDP